MYTYDQISIHTLKRLKKKLKPKRQSRRELKFVDNGIDVENTVAETLEQLDQHSRNERNIRKLYEIFRR